MSTYNILVHEQDVGFLIEAIDLRARFLKDMIRADVQAINEERARQRDAERRAALPDPFEQDKPIIVPKEVIEVSPAQVVHAEAASKDIARGSRKAKRAALMRILKSKGSAELTTAEIARRAGVSYVTAHKARAAFAPKKGRK